MTGSPNLADDSISANSFDESDSTSASVSLRDELTGISRVLTNLKNCFPLRKLPGRPKRNPAQSQQLAAS